MTTPSFYRPCYGGSQNQQPQSLNFSTGILQYNGAFVAFYRNTLYICSQHN